MKLLQKLSSLLKSQEKPEKAPETRERKAMLLQDHQDPLPEIQIIAPITDTS
jgi:hypothetical protein